MKIKIQLFLLFIINSQVLYGNGFADEKNFEDLKKSLLFYVPDSKLFRNNCQEISVKLLTKLSATTQIKFKTYLFSIYDDPTTMKKCLKLETPSLGFVNEEDASLIYFSTIGFNKINKNSVFKYKINFYRFANLFCNSFQRNHYVPETKTNYFINLCGHKTLNNSFNGR